MYLNLVSLVFSTQRHCPIAINQMHWVLLSTQIVLDEARLSVSYFCHTQIFLRPQSATLKCYHSECHIETFFHSSCHTTFLSTDRFSLYRFVDLKLDMCSFEIKAIIETKNNSIQITSFIEANAHCFVLALNSEILCEYYNIERWNLKWYYVY